MIRLTRRPAVMLQRAGSWRSILAGFALTLLVAGVVSLCVTGHTDADGRISAEPAAAAGHDHLGKFRAGPGIEPSPGIADRASGGGDHDRNCCAQDVPPATEAAVQRPEDHQPPAVSAPVPANSVMAALSRPRVNAGPAPPAPSLIQLSISRT
jgi:hypothetical protein